MDNKRGAIVVGASVAALVAGWYIRRWYTQQAHEQEVASAEEVRNFDKTMEQMNRPKRARRNTNGRAKTAPAG
jgi:hypothetical protein